MQTIPNTDRQSFGRTKEVLEYPDFLDIQLESFEKFVQLDIAPNERVNQGLQRIFLENFPIQDTRETHILEFLYYNVDVPRYTIKECQDRGLTYSVPLKAKLRLSSVDDSDEASETIEQEVFLGDLPWMTNRGTFIINGAERVIVSQLHRSPGVFFGQSVHPNGTQLYSARVIPFKGSWIEFTTDIRDVLWAYIDRKKKIPATTLLRALGYSTDLDLLSLFELSEEIKVGTKANFKKNLVGKRLAQNIIVEEMEEVVDDETGEVTEALNRKIIFERDHELTEDDYGMFGEVDQKTVLVQKITSEESERSVMMNTLRKDPTWDETSALGEVYQQIRSGEMPDPETARSILERLFFSDKKYDLGEVGRYRLNKRLRLEGNEEIQYLLKEDIVAIIREVIRLKNMKSQVDDIDHLSNRRVRTVGEQLGQQFAIGLARMARTIKERMNSRDAEQLTPQDLVNARTISSVINTFFGTNQLSQFMDQTNPLAELTHKRRMSALGPGGLTRERAGFEVRDVHYTHYGRLCPIETPEGPNIGLISSLCIHAKVNDFGFIETPYRKVKDKKVSKSVEYLAAEQEDETVIAQANAELDENNTFANDAVFSRMREGNYLVAKAEEIEYMDVATNQITSLAAALIPFIEHDDANRALMGSNMQRQAVPLLRPEAPVVGTGLEHRAARDSRAIITADAKGEVVYVSSTEIRIKYERDELDQHCYFDGGIKSYELEKFSRTNQDTCTNQRAIVKVGDKVKKGQAIADGCSTDGGELALGRNLLVAFMPWRGYNFEDAIVVSERIVQDDIYTSIHITEFEQQVRDTKRGEEELTREIPNVSEEATRNLNEKGIIRVGAKINPGDILVGKITPKGETDPTPEEKLLRAIFGDKAGDVKDASLKTPPGVSGTVINTKLFSRKRDELISRKEEKKRVEQEQERHAEKLAELNQQWADKMYSLLRDKTSPGVLNYSNVELIPKGEKYKKSVFEELDPVNINENIDWATDQELVEKVRLLFANYRDLRRKIDSEAKRRTFAIQVGDELPPGIIQKAKIYVAKKRKLQVGDKMAGRHGNKGVVAKIVPQEDMPFMADGTPVDICLNPLGVPSRMNLGQIYETILGWAAKKLGVTFASPIFDGASMDDVKGKLREAGLPEDGRVNLYDGRTGEPFSQKTTVGYIYMIKLNHLVQDKMHSRSIGPYSLITQQPLGGKAQFGGQRLGEMEVWALYAYGASSILKEMLTVKSDDVKGRSKVYEAIVKGENLPDGDVPESFKVLLRELMGLGLEIHIQ
ncbi:MAG: DNA-directed RNA polymerase subunit beta [Bacteroidetes bacterium]|jgi:DNA-directed RNA polymerase subunit beta|nr:DNA-directed RNA polymerase subunit beta [Bacteroidota bacterium]MAC06262.1 DNA-directed RNA polymerase subunit beta [Balneola sp.]MAO78445.1 DNA-directed RNA polymerase subunit beta [Balneola sp.]MBF63074.1 DNA-directed RNA polymerase subunit beta [Balneola sp.]|tara:strand:+ start:3305 stop:7120 length:3816 start_codon:yes stop_codon:yes gene_type:complete